MNSNYTNNSHPKKVQDTFEKIYYGKIENLRCPFCSSLPLRFSYTWVKPDSFGIWISCTFCQEEAHLRLKGRPPGYNQQNVLQEFQERDEEAVKLTETWWKQVSEDKD